MGNSERERRGAPRASPPTLDAVLTCVNQLESDSSIMREKTAAASAALRSGSSARCTYRTASSVTPGMPDEAICIKVRTVNRRGRQGDKKVVPS